MLLIRRLGPGDTACLQAYLLGLSKIDRRLRFSGVAGDSLIRHYCASIDWGRSAFFGCFSEGELVGEIHLLWPGLGKSEAVEFVLSVRHRCRGRGIGLKLLSRAVGVAHSRGVQRLRFVCPAEDEPMQRLALRMGGKLVTDGVHVDGVISVPDAQKAESLRPAAPPKRELRRSGTR